MKKVTLILALIFIGSAAMAQTDWSKVNIEKEFKVKSKKN